MLIEMIYDIYLLTAIGLTPSGSITIHIYTQTIHRTTQLTQTIHKTGPGVAQWLRHCTTSREGTVSLAIFSVVPLTEPCALRSTQPLKVSTRDFFWGKAAGAFG